MNHIHGAHALHTLRALASPTCAAIMADHEPARVRLRIMAEQINGIVEAGDRLDGLELRALIYALHDVADKMGEAPQPMRRARDGWWRRVFG